MESYYDLLASFAERHGIPPQHAYALPAVVEKIGAVIGQTNERDLCATVALEMAHEAAHA